MGRFFLSLVTLGVLLTLPLPDAHARRIVVKTKTVVVAARPVAVVAPAAVIKTKTVIKGRR